LALTRIAGAAAAGVDPEAGPGSVVDMLVTFLIVWRIDADSLRDLRESLRIPAGDRPIAEQQILAWWRRKRKA